MKNEMIEKYIYAVTRKLPRKMRSDVSQEIQTLIADMLEERCGELEPSEKDIRVVLAEIGTPDELVEQYTPEKENYFIAEPYYSKYIFTAKIVTLSVFCIVAVWELILLLTINFNGDIPYFTAHLILGIVILASVTFSAFGIVTLIFSILYRRRLKKNSDNLIPKRKKANKKTKEEVYIDIDHLPEVPTRQKVKIVIESSAGIVLGTLFGIIPIFFPEKICFFCYWDYAINIININEVRGSWYLIAIISALGIAREVIRLVYKKYNFNVLAFTVIADTVSAFSAVIWLSNYEIFDTYLNKKDIYDIIENPQFFPQIIDAAITLFCNNFITLIVFILALDISVTVWRYYKSNTVQTPKNHSPKNPFLFLKLKKI